MLGDLHHGYPNSMNVKALVKNEPGVNDRNFSFTSIEHDSYNSDMNM